MKALNICPHCNESIDYWLEDCDGETLDSFDRGNVECPLCGKPIRIEVEYSASFEVFMPEPEESK
jgi:hypothetical protein